VNDTGCCDAAGMSQRRQQKYSDGSVYDGEWNGDGEKHGHGSLTYSNNTQCTGQFQHGLLSGRGVMIIPDTSDKYDCQSSYVNVVVALM